MEFPNCIGAIDGKHIVMQPPADAGSYYYNYKNTHSIVLMAVAGRDYDFSMQMLAQMEGFRTAKYLTSVV